MFYRPHVQGEDLKNYALDFSATWAFKAQTRTLFTAREVFEEFEKLRIPLQSTKWKVNIAKNLNDSQWCYCVRISFSEIKCRYCAKFSSQIFIQLIKYIFMEALPILIFLNFKLILFTSKLTIWEKCMKISKMLYYNLEILQKLLFFDPLGWCSWDFRMDWPQIVWYYRWDTSSFLT